MTLEIVKRTTDSTEFLSTIRLENDLKEGRKDDRRSIAVNFREYVVRMEVKWNSLRIVSSGGVWINTGFYFRVLYHSVS
jgi:hypothetical protein